MFRHKGYYIFYRGSIYIQSLNCKINTEVE
nr:MAG TPA: hypothetical protein [Caudoviricetes sp.]